jgi:ATP-dependent metalloprotease FtsH
MSDINPQNPKSGNNSKKPKMPPVPKFNFYWIYGIITVIFIAIQFMPHDVSLKTTWFKVQNDMIMTNDVEKIVVVNKERAEVYLKKDAIKNDKYKELKDRGFFGEEVGPHYYFEIGDVNQFSTDLNNARAAYEKNNPGQVIQVPVEYVTQRNYLGDILGWILPILLLIGFWMFVMRRMGGGAGGAGGQIFNIGKSKAQLFDKETQVKTTFKDVAGLDEAKVEIMEIVDFLKNPKKYTNLGGKIPKGALLVGPPGTGKTLLAKAVAGEAGVPFFSLSGSDFVEMFVGVGASRVRDLFRQAKEKAPCIIFIDEIDAVGRARGRNAVQGGNDERENTLNQLLTEMDGFATDLGVIILAATNRPDILDSALLRPGRFDRQISIDKPDLNGREEIFKVHLKPLKLAADISAAKLAVQTVGFAGADIANVCNEAALIAARKNKESIDMQDFLDAVDRIVGGLEKKNKIITAEEKKVIAYHESGHATISWLLEHAHPLIKVTIVPRGQSLGAAWYLPNERQITTTEQMLDEICATLGGRAAEEIIFGRISTGALSDLEVVTKKAYAMVSIYGLNAKVGNISYYDSQGGNEYGFTKPYSERTAQTIDEEVSKLIEIEYVRAKQILSTNKHLLIQLADRLLTKEVAFKEDLEEILGKRPYISREEELSQINGAAKLAKEATEAAEVASETEAPADTDPVV